MVGIPFGFCEPGIYVFDGEESDMAKVVDALERSDVQVRYWNKSVRSSTRPPAAEWKPDPERLAMPGSLP